MASLLHCGVYYRGILKNVLPLIHHLKSGECAKAMAKRNQHARFVNFSSRCFCTNYVQKKLVQNSELNSDGSLVKKLDRALYRLDMDVKRTGRISLRDVNEIFNEIKSMGNPTNTQCLLLIRCCGSLLPEELPEARNKLVNDIWKTLEAQKIVFDASHYNAILKVYLENEYDFLPTEFLANMQTKGVEPNRVTYQRLIAHYCQKGDILGASKILEFMKEKDLPINENVFNALIQGHARANDMENAKSVLEIMRNAKLDPGPGTYAQLLCCYAEKGDFDSIKATLSEMKKNEINLLDRDYLEIIYALAVNGHGQYVDELIPQMNKAYGYNQDVVNFILQLVNKNQEEIAYKLLLTMPRSTSASGDPVPVGMFFIRHMVKMSMPKDKIEQICNDLKTRGLNANGILRAIEASLVFENSEYATHFLEMLKAQNVPIRPHYFWPIFAQHKKNHNEQGIYDTISLMSKLGVTVNFDTFLDYVFPALSLEDPSSIVHKLKEYGHSVGSIVGPLIVQLVIRQELENAVHLCKTFPVRLVPYALTQALAQAYHNTKDLNNTLHILLKVNSNLEPNNRIDWTGNFLLDFARFSKSIDTDLLPLLEGLKSKGLNISPATNDVLHRRFGQSLSKSICDLLDDLSVSPLNVVISDDFDSSRSMQHPRDMTVSELEDHLIELKSKNMNTRGVLRGLLLEHCRLKNCTRVMQIKEELDKLDFIYSPAMYSQLMNLYATNDNLKEALDAKDQILQADPEFHIDDHKILNLSALMVKEDMLEDAIKLLTEHYQKHGIRQKVEGLAGINWKLLNAAAEKGDVDGVKRLFDLVIKFGYAAPVNMTLGALIKVHIIKDDLSGALAEFEHCCKTYQSTPWKTELFLRLIKLEDSERLQKVVDLSTEIHGEMNTMYDLAFAFLEGDQIKPAKKIFETPGFRARPNRLESVCERFLEEGKIKQLEQLALITRDVFDIDRDRLYYHLIRAYAKAGDTTKALGVWTTMQEENVQPSDNTLSFLGNFLLKNGQPVPFAFTRDKAFIKKNPDNDIDVMVKNSNANEAMNLKSRLEGEGKVLTSDQNSVLMGTLLLNDKVSEALSIAKELFDRGDVPHASKLRALLHSLANSGDIENVNYVGNYVNENVKRKVGYNTLKALAFIHAGRHLELLDTMESGCPENAAEVSKTSLIFLLKRHPELVERVDALVKRYAENNYHAPLNMLWQYHIMMGETAKAEEIYKSTPRFQEKLMFLDIIKEARLNKDETLLFRLLEAMKNTNIENRPKGILYSAFIDVFCAKSNVDEAIKIYNEGIEMGLRNSDFNASALKVFQNNLSAAGKPIPFDLNNRTDSSSDSDSDSSSDSSVDELK